MIYVNPNVRASSRDGYVIATFIADTVSELPATNYLTGYTLEMGSTCHVIENSADYEMQSSGTWVQRVPFPQQNMYTKSQTDAMLAAIEGTIYVHDSVQVNLNDITWTQSGGGMYYSQTIQLPDIALLYSVCLSGFASLRATDIIQPACRRSGGWSGFTLYANTNSFNSGAWVTVSGIGTRASQ